MTSAPFAEGRLSAGQLEPGSPFTYYQYDADGELARKSAVPGQGGTIYIGGIFEKNTATGEITKYYFAGGQRVAMRWSYEQRRALRHILGGLYGMDAAAGIKVNYLWLINHGADQFEYFAKNYGPLALAAAALVGAAWDKTDPIDWHLAQSDVEAMRWARRSHRDFSMHEAARIRARLEQINPGKVVFEKGGKGKITAGRWHINVRGTKVHLFVDTPWWLD